MKKGARPVTVLWLSSSSIWTLLAFFVNIYFLNYWKNDLKFDYTGFLIITKILDEPGALLSGQKDAICTVSAHSKPPVPCFYVCPSAHPSLRCIALLHGFRWCWCWCHRPPPSIPVTAAPPFSPHLRPSSWFTNRPSSGTAGASRTHPRCLPVRSSPSSLLPPTVLSPTSRSWLTHRRCVLTLHHTLRRCRGAEGWATPLLCPFSTFYRRILHVWMRRGQGCCRLTEGREGG